MIGIHPPQNVRIEGLLHIQTCVLIMDILLLVFAIACVAKE